MTSTEKDIEKRFGMTESQERLIDKTVIRIAEYRNFSPSEIRKILEEKEPWGVKSFMRGLIASKELVSAKELREKIENLEKFVMDDESGFTDEVFVNLQDVLSQLSTPKEEETT